MKRSHLIAYDPLTLPDNFWTSIDCEILVLREWASKNIEATKEIIELLPEIKSHVWISSSGTLSNSNESKWISLSKEALLSSAAAVNTHLNIKPDDLWGLSLPIAHVGGLGVLARSFLQDNKVIPLIQSKWNPQYIVEQEYQWLSLVPTQLHDLVVNNLSPQKRLKGVIIGGDSLRGDIHQKALELRWPVLRSFGMSECASQIATEQTPNSMLSLLPHVEALSDTEERLHFKSTALYTSQAVISSGQITITNRQNEWWPSSDRGLISDRVLTPLGRLDSVIKIKGERIDLESLELQIQSLLKSKVALLCRENIRKGKELWIISETQIDLELLNKKLLKHQQITGFHMIDFLPTTTLGKFKRQEICSWLENKLGSNNA